MNEKEQLAKKLFMQNYPLDKISQITGLNQTWLEIKINQWNRENERTLL